MHALSEIYEAEIKQLLDHLQHFEDITDRILNGTNIRARGAIRNTLTHAVACQWLYPVA